MTNNGNCKTHKFVLQATYKLYVFIGRTSTSSSRNITSHKLSLACKLTLFLLLSLRKRAIILVAWEEVHEWPMGGGRVNYSDVIRPPTNLENAQNKNAWFSVMRASP